MTFPHPYAVLFDIGNTRIKWGVYDLEMGVWHQKGYVPPVELTEWLIEQQALLNDAACLLGSNVAAAHLQAAIEQATSTQIEWVSSSAYRAEVRNGYDQPEKLGTDRWISLIAARSAHPGSILVVNAGTAVTIDVLDETGFFRGGCILPGLQLMRQSLAQGTAGLPMQTGAFSVYPTNTGDALLSGAIQAIAGGIMQMAHQMLADGIPPGMCLISGGDAVQIAPHLSIPVTIVDHLVLDGLASLAIAAFSSTRA